MTYFSLLMAVLWTGATLGFFLGALMANRAHDRFRDEIRHHEAGRSDW